MKYLTLVLLLLFSCSSVLAQQESLGVVEQNQCIRIYQTCPSCSYVNISSVIYPNKSVAISSIALTTDDDFEYYTNFCNTSLIGEYIVNGKGDIDGVDTSFAYGFEVTSSGRVTSDSKVYAHIILFVFFVLIILTFYYTTKNINYEKWYDSILRKYENRNMVKVIISSIGYNLMKNKFIWYYLFGLPIILLITDIAYTFGVDSMIYLLKIVLSVYYYGFLLVAVFFFGYLQEWVANIIDQIKSMDYGV